MKIDYEKKNNSNVGQLSRKNISRQKIPEYFFISNVSRLKKNGPGQS